MSTVTEDAPIDGPVEPGVYRLQARTRGGRIVYYVAEEHPTEDRVFIAEGRTAAPEDTESVEAELWGAFTRGEYRPA